MSTTRVESENNSIASKWLDHHFLLELKPRAEYANLFIDCPPDSSSTNELVKLTEYSIEVGAGAESRNELEEGGGKLTAKLSDIQLYPNTVCGLGWADNDRLFTCRVRAQPSEVPLVSKTAAQLAREIRGRTTVDDRCRLFTGADAADQLIVECRACGERLLQPGGRRQWRALPCDDWEQLVGSIDYFCHDGACGGGGVGGGGVMSLGAAVPSASEAFMSDSYVVLPTGVCRSLVVNAGPPVSTTVHCDKCLADIGRIRRMPGVGGGDGPTSFQLYHSCISILTSSDASQDYILQRFGSFERYFAWLLLSQCDSQTSLKFLLRSFDKVGHLLIWLLDSYSVFARGRLQPSPPSDDLQTSAQSPRYRPFPVVKLLYKIFDPTAAACDPRANGQDSSVTIIEQPASVCADLGRRLLDSTHALPPACRSVGQFFVGYLKLADVLEG